MFRFILWHLIGGFSLAASWVWGEQHEIVEFVEIDPFCQKVLKKHWPMVPIHDDIKTFDGEKYAGTIDLVHGGFPCQPFSVAGKQRGKEDNRYLWPEMLRVIRTVYPRWVIAENVPGIINIKNGMVFGQVLSDLETEGYEVQPFIIPACAVNAPHRRDRVWIVGYASKLYEYDGRNKQKESRTQIPKPGNSSSKDDVAYAEQPRTGMEKHRSGGQERQKTKSSESKILRQELRPGCSERIESNSQDVRNPAIKGLPDWSGGEMGQPWPLTQFERPGGREVERNFRGMAYGIPNRTHRLKSLGNAIVPQVVVPIMQAIKEVDEQCHK